jgi:hypothetical protein
MQDTVTLMLSARQANLLLSSLWTQTLSPENVPRNYEAISHTYSLMLLFSGAKVRVHYSVLYLKRTKPSLHSILLCDFGDSLLPLLIQQHLQRSTA